MATQRKHRRGTTAELDAFTPSQAEIVVDTTLNQLRVGDGSTLGGYKVPTSASPTFTGDVTADSIKTSGSSGVVVKNSGGTTVATFGSANTTNVSLAGAVNIGGLITATAGQIAFPATQNPSADANTLDDYEEGTWTPVYTYATPGDLSVVYSVQVGSYTKIGDVVNLFARLVTTTHTYTTASGNQQITGTPFAAKTLTNARWVSAASFNGITKAGYGQIVARIDSASSTVIFDASGSAVSTSTVSAGTDAPSATQQMRTFGLTYQSAT